MKKSASLVAETVDLLNEVIVTDIGGRRVVLPITMTGDEDVEGGEHPVEKYFRDLGQGRARPPVVEKLPTKTRIEPVTPKTKDDEEKKKKRGKFLNSANSFLERIAEKPGLASLVADMQPILTKLATFAVQNPIDADDAFLQIRNDTKKMKAVVRLHKLGEPNVPITQSPLSWPDDIKDIVLIPGPRGGGIGKGEIATCMMYRNASPSADGASPTAKYDIEDNLGQMSVKYSQPLGKELKVNNVDQILKDKLVAKGLVFKGEINKGTFLALTKGFNDQERSQAAQDINDAVRDLYGGDQNLTYLFTSKDSYIRVPTNDPRIKFYGTTQGKVAINFGTNSWIDAYDTRATTISPPTQPQTPGGGPKLDSRGLPEVPRMPLPESRRRKPRRSEASMGGVLGAQVPMGRGPDGKPDRRTSDAILRKNGMTQARYFGGGSIVEETRELLLDLLDD